MAVEMFVIMVLAIAGTYGQQYGDHRGFEFIAAFIHNPAAESHSLFLTSEVDATVTISSDHMILSKDINLDAFAPYREELDTSFHYQSGMAFNTERKAVHITSTSAISVYGTEFGSTSGDGFLVIPMQRLTGHYIAVSRNAVPDPSHLVIVGTENNTIVNIQIRLGSGTCASAGYVNGNNLSKIINRFDVVGLTCTGDITGTVITSDKAIAVFSGNEKSSFPLSGTGSDMLIEMMIPVETFGQSYVLTNMANSLTSPTYRVVASQDNTIVSVNGFVLFTLQTGDYEEYQGSNINRLLESTAPILLVIYDNLFVDSVGDAYMALVPSTDSFFKRPFYDFNEIVPNVDNDNLFVTIYFNTTKFPGITFEDPDIIIHIPGTDIATFATLASDVEGSNFESEVQEIGLVVYAHPESSAAYGYLGGMTFRFDPCETAQCINGGECIRSGSLYYCNCQPGYTGDFCGTDIGECDSSPCMNNGTCNNTVNAYACECVAGFTGTDCETDIDDCAMEPCLNNGTCQDNVNAYTCECQPGFTGTDCQTDIDDCAMEPCLNNGTCHDNVNAYTCECAPGFTGTDCQTDIDDCAMEPCLNNGTCHDNVNAYTCECQPGFTGTDCQTDIDDCAMEPCLNNGTCHDNVNAYTCECAPGFTGTNCQTDIDDCAMEPCLNNGTCHDNVNAYTCECALGFTGTNCQTDIDDCAMEPCLNNGTCHDNVNAYTCECALGFTGTDCQTDIDDCAVGSCLNNGTCHDNVNAFTCDCLEGFTGTDCGIDIDDCKNFPCRNGGSCIDDVNGFICICQSGFTGETCESVFTSTSSPRGSITPTAAATTMATATSIMHTNTSENNQVESTYYMTSTSIASTSMTSTSLKSTSIASTSITSTSLKSTSIASTSIASTLVTLESSGNFQTSSVLQPASPEVWYTYSYTRIIYLDQTRIIESGTTVFTREFQPTMYETDNVNGVLVSCDHIAPTESHHQCLCTSYESPVYVMTEDRKEEIQEEIKKKLLVDATNLTKTLLKYKSVEDNRPSARSIGSVGIVMLALVGCLIVIPDVCAFLKNLMRKMIRGRRY